ncbi:MAG: serine/threonine-protein kinase [Gemmatimonadota bacterium]|nr:serine/threonine-protein kinase [Gemmatimonadota bacterium]
MNPVEVEGPNRVSRELAPHLASWHLPPDWAWGTEGVWADYRHYQELIDGLGRSLSLVSAPDPAHAPWLAAEARHLAHRNHPAIPTTYHYWAMHSDSPRGPGYLRRWIAGETVGARFARLGAENLTYVLQLIRTVGSAVAYLHNSGMAHGAVAPETVWVTPTGRLWLLGWEWAMPHGEIPSGLRPNPRWVPPPPEATEQWMPTAASDQWQLAATAFAALTGEYPPTVGIPPIALVRPDCPHAVAEIIDRALLPDPADRLHSVAAMLRSLDRAVGGRTSIYVSGSTTAMRLADESEESRLRWATGEDYEVLARLGAGTFGAVWRVRDLTLEREVALKMLHPEVASDDKAVRRFRREAQLAAQLAHPAIVPIYDWDSNGDVSWYTMELAEGGSLAELIARSGPRPLHEIAPQIEHVLDGLAAAHAAGIIHRDLKPENILIDRYRRWRITDFGVAKIPGEDLPGTTGTPEFAAPEQLLGEPQGSPVDCYAMAAITVFVITGQPPFGSGDEQVILARELAGNVDLTPYPPEIAAWVERGLDPLPDHRFTDAAEMHDYWRQAVEAVMEREQRSPWWRRWFAVDSTEDASS